MEISDVIAHVESGGNQYAQRFERLHLGASKPSLIASVSRINAVSAGTADVYCAMSHGLYQIMGYELYGLQIAYSSPLWKFLTDISEQLAVFKKFLLLDGLDHFTVADFADDSKAEHFATLYNGPGNVADYVMRIRKAIKELSGDATNPAA